MLQATVSIILLKVASVIGREFQIGALKQIQPIYKSASQMKFVDDGINLLEKRDFIEIVDFCGETNSLKCRFYHFLFKDSLYQMLKYKACTMELHRETEKYLQMLPSTLQSKDQDPEIKTLTLRHHMLLASNCTEERQLMLQQRAALVVLRIQNLLQV